MALSTDIKTRLRNLQRAPETKKKRWLIAGSAMTMVAVVALWVLYLNLTVPNPAGEAAAATATSTVQAEKSPSDSAWATFARGFSSLAEEFGSAWSDAREKMSGAFNNLKRAVEQENRFTFPAPTSTVPGEAGLPPASAGGAQAGTPAADLAPVPPTPLPEAALKGATAHASTTQP